MAAGKRPKRFPFFPIVKKQVFNPIVGCWVFSKKAIEMDRPRIQAAYKEIELGIYDTRDWSTIRTWAKERAQKF